MHPISYLYVGKAYRRASLVCFAMAEESRETTLGRPTFKTLLVDATCEQCAEYR